MSDSGPAAAGKLWRALLGVEVWKSSQKLRVRRSASLLAKTLGVRSIAWFGLFGSKVISLNDRKNLPLAVLLQKGDVVRPSGGDQLD